MVNYDPNIIQKFAERLYEKANSIIFLYTFIGFLLGVVGGVFLGNKIGGFTTTIVCAIIFALIGFAMGREKAFLLKLQAQTALCQMMIEQNTRKK